MVLLLTLQRDAPLPLSQQLAGLLRAQIESGKRAPGSRLPTIMQMSQEHGVATATVVKALRILKREGPALIRASAEPGVVTDGPLG
jgi:DNA-binding GntR family transcriptional regulator